MNAPQTLPALEHARQSAAPAQPAADRGEPAPETRPASEGATRWNPFGERAATEQVSLFGEILDWMLAPLLLLWPMSIVVTFIVARSLADVPFDRALQDQVKLLSQQVNTVGRTGSLREQPSLRDLLPSAPDVPAVFQVVAADGELLAGEASLPPPGLYDFPAPGLTKLRNEQFRGAEYRFAYTYVDVPDEPSRDAFPVLVQAAETLDARNALANEIIKGVIFPQFMILPIAVLLVWFALGRGLKPLAAIQRRIRARRPDDLSPIDRRGMPEELTPLVDAFNDLLSRLDSSMAAQKRFIADAAHQLRTPLAGLRTQAELALRQNDPEQLRKSLAQIATGSQRAANLVSQLLTMARMENLRESGRAERVELRALARAVCAEWVAHAMRRDIDFGFDDGGHDAFVVGQPILLREMFSNLIDNALRYTQRGGTVTVRIASGPGAVALEVEDDGPGISPADRELIFQRFHRVLGNEADGSGLGLSIVREIALAHDAEVSVQSGGTAHAACGSRFTVRFPAAPIPDARFDTGGRGRYTSRPSAH